MKNWFGREPHPSDKLVHWQESSWAAYKGEDFVGECEFRMRFGRGEEKL